MVSLRCKIIVKELMDKFGLNNARVELGMVELENEISAGKRELLKENLLMLGFELMDDKKSILIEKIKSVIIEMIHFSPEYPKVNFSQYLSEKLNHDYTYMSNVFSEVKGMTIQQFIILHKIERIKELLLYDELTLTEISYKLNYSNVSHLSNQFKSVTGFTPSVYKNFKYKRRNFLENL